MTTEYVNMLPQRIISVVPSQTELLVDLGLDNELVGLTKFCIHPADKVKSKVQIGGTKTLNLTLIDSLKPDLIIANKEENTREQIEKLQHQYPVHVTDINSLADALMMIRQVGNLVGKGVEAEQIADRIKVSLPFTQQVGLSVAYFIWRKPYMVAGNDTFIHSMLEVAGFRNAFAHQSRYPIITPEDVQTAHPDLIFLSSEPYPFAEKHVDEFKAICPVAQVLIVDGELFSWYGSRLLRSSDYFRNLRNLVDVSRMGNRAS